MKLSPLRGLSVAFVPAGAFETLYHYHDEALYHPSGVHPWPVSLPGACPRCDRLSARYDGGSTALHTFAIMISPVKGL